jgi:hypothetical protein
MARNGKIGGTMKDREKTRIKNLATCPFKKAEGKREKKGGKTARREEGDLMVIRYIISVSH